MQTTPLKLVIPALLAIGAATGIAAPALAGTGSVAERADAAMQMWSEQISSDLEHHLYFAQTRPGFQPVDGVAKLRFTLDANGRATDITILHSTGHRMTDRLAVKAVRSLRDLDKAPVADVLGRTFVAHLVFAKTEEQRRELTQGFARQEHARNCGVGGSHVAVSL